MAEVRVTSLCYTGEGSVERNKRKISRLLEKIPDTDFLLLPEDAPDIDGRYAEEIPGPFSLWLQDLALDLSINIIGHLTEKAEGALFSTSLIIDRKGRITGKYRKIQLSYSDEKKRNLTRGKEVSVFHLDGISFGVAVCYDIWYPQVIQRMALKGARIVFVPFKEEEIYFSYLRSLAAARAIENVICLACCGGGGRSLRFDLTFKPFAFFVLPSGRIAREETASGYAHYMFPDLETIIREEKRPKHWKRPFDGTLLQKNGVIVPLEKDRKKGTAPELN